MNRIAFSLLFLFAMLMASACVSSSQAGPHTDVTVGSSLLQDDFSNNKGWEARTADWAFMDIVNESYRMWLTRNVYIYGLYHEAYSNTQFQADALMLSDNPKTLYGLRCRANGTNNANGYYFLLSGDGAFSMRYGANNEIVALVEWQNNSAIHTDSRVNTIKAICSEDYLALYVNDTFVADARDERYRTGYIGMTLGLPQATTIDNPADVAFDNVRVWKTE
ncbi:MAG: hypothetical protein KC546_03700 [Anaerolineae bacterium]|nr:hypothetical protein [Anaerolineae bacterium]